MFILKSNNNILKFLQPINLEFPFSYFEKEDTIIHKFQQLTGLNTLKCSNKVIFCNFPYTI